MHWWGSTNWCRTHPHKYTLQPTRQRHTASESATEQPCLARKMDASCGMLRFMGRARKWRGCSRWEWNQTTTRILCVACAPPPLSVLRHHSPPPIATPCIEPPSVGLNHLLCFPLSSHTLPLRAVLMGLRAGRHCSKVGEVTLLLVATGASQ